MPARTSVPRLIPITAENLDAVCALAIRPEQEPFVEPVARSLAEAYVHPEIAWPRAVVAGVGDEGEDDGQQVVAFVMAFFDATVREEDPPDRLRSGLWRLNVDAAHQGRGYGRFAVEAVCAEIARRGGTRATVTWADGEHGPEQFYLRLGFVPTGEHSGGQIVAERELPAASAAADAPD